MSDLHELANLVGIGFRIDEIDGYLSDIVRPKMQWHPTMVVDHNTGLNPHWTKDTTIAQSVQLMRNTTVTYASLGWHSGPHWFLGPNLIAVAASPMWLPGTHSPSWNHMAIGVEHEGDFDKQPFPDDYRDFAVAFNKKLFRFLNKIANDANYKHHHEDPETQHKHCPGVNYGPKTWWIPAINALTPAEKLLDLPHIDLTTKKPVPVITDPFIRLREGTELKAYPDAGGWAVGCGTNMRPDGTRVKQGDTCTLDEAHAWQSARTADDWDKVQAMLTRPISDGLATAILSFCYEFNTDQFNKSSFKARVNEGNLQAAANSLYQWHNEHINGVLTPVDGLKKRRKMEIALFLPGWIAPIEPPVVSKPISPSAPKPAAILPASKPLSLIGESVMATTTTVTTTAPAVSAATTNKLNIGSILSMAIGSGILIPLLAKLPPEFMAYGIVGAAAMGLGGIIQSLIPPATAKAIEDAAITAAPIVEALIPSLKTMVDQAVKGLKDAQALTPAATTTAVVAAEVKTP